ncbi:hypothetical protein G9P44_006252 [Scheffersomyces stipitis]|nr:hypothetical protein G9P44_006252 [Scheffersomyces stipitis]
MAFFRYAWPVAVALGYLFYTLTYVCPIADPYIHSAGELHSLSPVVYHTCTFSNSYLKPVFHESVLPVYTNVVEPRLVAVDESLHISQAVDSTKQFVLGLDENYKISTHFENACVTYHRKVLELTDYLERNVYPEIWRYVEKARFRLLFYFRVAKLNVYVYGGVAYGKLDEFGVSSAVNNAVNFVTSIEFVQKLILCYQDIVTKLLEKKSSINLQQKGRFLQQEFKNLIKFNQFYSNIKSKGDVQKKNIAEIVKDLLNKVSDKTTDDEDYDSDVSDEEEEPIVVLLTSTITVTDESVPTSDVSVEAIQDPTLLRINEELQFWETKVNKTLQLAQSNLEIEMKPIVNNSIESIKPQISILLSNLQKDCYSQYQILSKKISEINKDYEKIKQTNDSTIETVSRQEIRDDIAATYKLPEGASEAIQQLLVDTHDQVLVEYFKVVQDTIDILESFSETTIQEFSKQLTSVLDELELEDDEITWKTWKRFHRVKEDIFKFRDFIFDTANEYKTSNNKDLKALGLDGWNDYLKNVEFHINYLVRDNDDYLRLVRAKANVAFQLREATVRKLEEENADAEERFEETVEEVQEPIPEVVSEDSAIEEVEVDSAVEDVDPINNDEAEIVEEHVDSEKEQFVESSEAENFETEEIVEDENSETEEIVENESSDTEAIVEDESSDTEAIVEDESSGTEEIVDDESSNTEEIVDDESSDTEEIVDENSETEETIDENSETEEVVEAEEAPEVQEEEEEEEEEEEVEVVVVEVEEVEESENDADVDTDIELGEEA